jgi:signal transduction histidine kinase/HAMP domain-containing protein
MLGSRSSGLKDMLHDVAAGPDRTVRAAARRIRAIGGTIRGKILLAFCALATITGLLGLYAVNSVADSGRLVVETYDKPLMAISYARLALSKFTEMKLAFAQRSATRSPERRKKLDEKISRYSRSLSASVGVAEERSLSRSAALAAHETRRAVENWETARTRLENVSDKRAGRAELEARAAAVVTAIDQLVEITATDGFRHREQALSSIKSYYRLSIVATIGALLLSIIIAILLARQMVRPIAAASHAAGRMAEGDLDVDVKSESNDELGQLLGSMAIMRDNIRGMMAREIEARRSAQTRLVNAIESSAEGVVLVDAEGCIVRANSQIMKFFPELKGAFEAGAVLPAAMDCVLTQQTHSMQLADGRWLRLSRSDTADHGFVIICSDITALKEQESILQVAKEQAEAANRSKSQFLANMSHELRTPLNAIIGFSEIIRDALMGPVSARYQEYARDICSSGSHLLSVINDTLDLSKIEVGQLDIYEEVVDLTEVITACNRIVREKARAGQLDLVVDIASDLPNLKGDQRRLKQVFINLLSNAVKFTPPEGSIIVAAKLLATGEIAISVADTGIGMNPDDVPLALAPFQQLDGELNRRYEGTGLGLPLVQRLIDLHDGVMEIETAPGKGTTINITLPADRTINGASADTELSASLVP